MAESKSGKYQPKAVKRHEKISRSKIDEIDAFRERIANNKHKAKSYESSRKQEIKNLPKEERRQAKEDLKESIRERKLAEMDDKETLREMIAEERGDRVNKKGVTTSKRGDSFDEDAWIAGGRKRKSEAKAEPALESEPEVEVSAASDAPQADVIVTDSEDVAESKKDA